MAPSPPLPSPPVLQRPSSWPVRNQRRHVATTNFNAEVVNSLASITTKLDSGVAALAAKLDMVLEEIRPSQFVRGMDELGKRIDSMELLLFRTHLKDFQAIDANLDGMLRESLPLQPEPELSPPKRCGLIQLKHQHAEAEPPVSALNFDIYDERVDAASQWEPLDISNCSYEVTLVDHTLPSVAGQAVVIVASVGVQCEDNTKCTSISSSQWLAADVIIPDDDN